LETLARVPEPVDVRCERELEKFQLAEVVERPCLRASLQNRRES